MVNGSHYSKGVRSPGIYVYIYGEKIYVYIYFLGSFGNLASLGSRINGKWKLPGERPLLEAPNQLLHFVTQVQPDLLEVMDQFWENQIFGEFPRPT